MENSCEFMFLSQGEQTFLMHSLKDSLTAERFRTDKCDIGMKQLGSLNGYPAMFVVDAAVLNECVESRVYLYDLCIENNIKLVLIGDTDALDELLKITSPKIVAASFERPINNKEVVKDLAKILENMHAKSLQHKVLVVDDSPVFLRTVSEWLEKDYKVSICPSATAAFNMINAIKPELILLDYEMPVCSGSQFLGMLRSESATADIPVIFLTSRGDGEAVKAVLSLKPQGYLLKNQPKDKILDAIANFFASLEK